MDFKAFPKMARLNREIVITEKIDGTNAQVYITETVEPPTGQPVLVVQDSQDIFHAVYAGSRTRWITPEDDNFGFAKWVKANAEELLKLGPGQHFGEWWGQKIQRGYGLTEKRFSLFNTGRWIERCRAHRAVDNTCVCPDCGYVAFSDDNITSTRKLPEHLSEAPACCHVVPVLYKGPFDIERIEYTLDELSFSGSVAAPGFKNPEGIVIYHTAANSMFKVTLDNDGVPKSLVA